MRLLRALGTPGQLTSGPARQPTWVTEGDRGFGPPAGIPQGLSVFFSSTDSQELLLRPSLQPPSLPQQTNTRMITVFPM